MCPLVEYRPLGFCSTLMALSYMRLCTIHVITGLQVCGYATLSKAPRPQEKTISAPVFHYVSQHKKPTHKVCLYGASASPALRVSPASWCRTAAGRSPANSS